jgi:hypothetical protein
MMLALAKDLTFRIEVVDDCWTIVCLLCGAQSAHPKDLDQRYCNRCHLFHDVVHAARRLAATRTRTRSTHDCHEWRTALGVCAVCGRDLR